MEIKLLWEESHSGINCYNAHVCHLILAFIKMELTGKCQWLHV